MKEFDEKPTSIEIKEVAEERKEIQWIGQMLMIKGLPVWEYDPETKILKQAEVEQVQAQIEEKPRNIMESVSPKSEVTHHYVIKHRESCFYFQALNYKNAIKKVNKQIIGNQ